MNHAHHHRIRNSLLAGSIVMAIGLLGGTAVAQAAPCVLTPATGSATQTSTTVTGGPANDTIDCSGATTVTTINGNGGNDTITGNNLGETINGGDGNDTMTGGTGVDALNGGLGIDTINGMAGNDTLIGASTDGSQDSLFAGDGTDTCQGPAPDPDIHNSCENTSTPPASGPGSSRASATELCRAAGGRFVDLGPLAYNCVFLNAFSNHRVAEARQVCTDRTGAFVNAALIYSCVLP
jgi:RTX calcium-binding nonapeptide repeat (4 copies)